METPFECDPLYSLYISQQTDPDTCTECECELTHDNLSQFEDTCLDCVYVCQDCGWQGRDKMDCMRVGDNVYCPECRSIELK